MIVAATPQLGDTLFEGPDIYIYIYICLWVYVCLLGFGVYRHVFHTGRPVAEGRLSIFTNLSIGSGNEYLFTVSTNVSS